MASLALSRRPWTTDSAVAALPDDPVGEIHRALAYLDDAFVPVPIDPQQRAAWNLAMDERLRRLAVKIAPAMSPAQTELWRQVMVDALSDLPAMIALTAAKRAIHRPMKFLNEVEAIVREIADTVATERRLARRRLEGLREHIRRPRPVALPPQEPGAPFSLDEIRKLSPTFRSLGVSSGAFTQQQLDEVEAADPTGGYLR
jgi:hypothetical protein